VGHGQARHRFWQSNSVGHVGVSKTHKWKVEALLCLQGCLIEVLLYFSGNRFGDWQDALADSIGVTLGSAVFVLLAKFDFITRLLGQSIYEGKENTSDASQDDQKALKTSEPSKN